MDIDKLTPVPNDLAKLSNVVKNDVVKKTEFNNLVGKVNNIDITKFVSRTKYERDGSDIEKKISDVDKKIPDVSGLVKKINFNAKVTEIEGKIPSITGLATDSALTAVENKMPNVSNLVTKTNYNTKISEIEGKLNNHNHEKYITTPEFNTLAAGVFDARLRLANLVTKTDFDIKLKGLSGRINSNKTRNLLIETELKKIKTFDVAYFKGTNYFSNDSKNYLVFDIIS